MADVKNYRGDDPKKKDKDEKGSSVYAAAF
jgi:hypothetical protein